MSKKNSNIVEASSLPSTSSSSTGITKGEKINVLLTGATGYIGSNTIDPLIKSGLYNVFALARRSSSTPKIFRTYSTSTSFRIIFSDFVEFNNGKNNSQNDIIDHLRSIIIENNIKIIIHLAAMMDFYPSDNSKVYTTNVIGTENLLKASIRKSVLKQQQKQDKQNNKDEQGDSDSEESDEESSSDEEDNSTGSKSSSLLIDRFIYCSSTEAMGGSKVSPTQELRDETSECHPDFYYGDTKVEAEKLVRAYSDQYGLDSIILRFTGVYGKDDDFSMFELMQACSYGLIFFIPSHATGSVMYTYIDDVTQSIVLAAKKVKNPERDSRVQPSYTYIISPDRGLTYKEVIEFVNLKLNRMKPRLVVPTVITFPLISLLGKIMYIIKPKKFLYKSDTLKEMGQDRLFNNSRAKKELGFKPQFTFKQGLNITIEEYLESERLSYYPVSPLFVITALLVLFIQFLITWIF